VSDPAHASGTKRNVKQVAIPESLEQSISEAKLKVTLLTVCILCSCLRAVVATAGT
jgi:hypothetical protein